MLNIVESISEWQGLRYSGIFSNKTIGFVPTMGALHEGHLSLVEKSKRENDITVVSIFVNPTQFNDKADLEKYPITFDEDSNKLEKLQVDYLLFPEYEEIYPDKYRYKISENMMSTKLCGKHREGHFDGVLTVVMKLLNIVDADKTYFGEKDYQQFLLIKDMAEAFFMKTKIIPMPIVREKDGLALSSRNKRLAKNDRITAPQFYQFLKSNLSKEEIKNQLNARGFKVEYIEEIGNRRFGAVYLGNVRLIDNVKI
jgi:pantoate--beta-alanine ligase